MPAKKEIVRVSTNWANEYIKLGIIKQETIDRLKRTVHASARVSGLNTNHSIELLITPFKVPNLNPCPLAALISDRTKCPAFWLGTGRTIAPSNRINYMFAQLERFHAGELARDATADLTLMYHFLQHTPSGSIEHIAYKAIGPAIDPMVYTI